MKDRDSSRAAEAGSGEPSSDGELSRQRRDARLRALAGATVLGRDGEHVGLVRDIYQHDASGELAAITVVRRQLSSRSVLIPASAIDELPPANISDVIEAASTEAANTGEVSAGAESAEAASEAPAGRRPGEEHPHPQAVRLRVDAETVRGGHRPPDISHATPQDLRAAASALGLAAVSGEEPPCA
ncbi:PRC-barrel domain-containing protein [Brachybacterium sp. YJGR34]|uniref:PRC-barrel domain-containing protein n=1 Tax=Brachybacterium sp. YJGR34 TaxID=2059911 RepID=UPI0018E61193|nr:PRC-barrel domain-containing protein [Brachybacterium sp. YJGR34]